MKPTTVTRRKFIVSALAGAGMLALKPVPTFASPRWPKDAAKYRIHVVGYTHIDPVWLWPWQEGVSVVHSTFRSVLDRMNETPTLTFSCGSAVFYQWIADNDPAMLAEIRERVREGRWEVTTGWWVEPDMNIPSGEAMVRQGLYGQRALEKLLGVRATLFYSADAFGHAGTLPQILCQQGMEDFIFHRPGGHEKVVPPLFQWEATDGSRVLTRRSPDGLNFMDSDGREFIIRQIATPETLLLARHGLGDHGGGPSIQNINAINALMNEKGAPTMVYSTYGRYFAELRSGLQSSPPPPTLRDDLQHHAPGCYTSECAIKQHNRRSEMALVTAEKVTAIGALFWNARYPAAMFEAAWKKVLFLQFHDSLAGTSIPEHSAYARDGYGYACEVANEATYMALQKLEWQVPSLDDPCHQYVVAFNPHAWAVQSVIEYQWGQWPPYGCDTPHTPALPPARVFDGNNNPLPHQWTLGQSHSGNRKATGLVLVTIPPMGYTQVREINTDTELTINHPVQATRNQIENEYLRVTVAPNGAIGVTDKASGQPVFAGSAGNICGCRAVVIDDPYDTWAHDVGSFDKEIGAFGDAELQLLENGPLRATIRCISTYGKSTLTIDWSLIAGLHRVEARVSLDWHERQKMLKFSFPVNVQAPEATYETPCGFIVRPPDGNEEPGQRWIDLTGQHGGGRCGLTVINDAKYGYSVHHNDMRISVARSAVFAMHAPDKVDPNENRYVWMDQGLQSFRMWLVPHAGSWRDIHVPRIADEFSAPPMLIYQGVHAGVMPKSAAYMSVDPPAITIPAVKKAEDGDAIIIRLLETFGQATTATLNIPAANIRWSGNFRACELKTLRVHTQTGAVSEVNLLEEPVHNNNTHPQ